VWNPFVGFILWWCVVAVCVISAGIRRGGSSFPRLCDRFVCRKFVVVVCLDALLCANTSELLCKMRGSGGLAEGVPLVVPER